MKRHIFLVIILTVYSDPSAFLKIRTPVGILLLWKAVNLIEAGDPGGTTREQIVLLFVSKQSYATLFYLFYYVRRQFFFICWITHNFKEFQGVAIGKK